MHGNIEPRHYTLGTILSNALAEKIRSIEIQRIKLCIFVTQQSFLVLIFIGVFELNKLDWQNFVHKVAEMSLRLYFSLQNHAGLDPLVF